MKVHIFDTDLAVTNKKTLLVLTRPYFQDNKWDIESINPIDEADFALIPFSINFYFKNKLEHKLERANGICKSKGIQAYAIISGDYGKAYPEFSNIIYFRMGGFASQLSDRNKGFPVALSDHFQRLYHLDNPIPRKKSEKPTIGFCGHANKSPSKKAQVFAKLMLENAKRFLEKPARKDFEPLFASAYERAQLLQSLERCPDIQTNFIYRKNYRGGPQTEALRTKTTMEYYDNLANSDYILCVRGTGNFSVRLYETLMMGKIPVFINTDCLLPFPSKIDWKKHMVFIEYENRQNLSNILLDFHSQLSNEAFEHIQIANRRLWKDTLSVAGILKLIENGI